MTPSEAHETALNRESGHDQLQIDVLKYLWTKPASLLSWSRPNPRTKEPARYEWAGTSPEVLFSGRFGVTFADLLIRYTMNETRDGKVQYSHIHDVIFEIKPKIYSAAAVVRQCEMMGHRIAQFDPFGGNGGQNKYSFSIYPLVLHDDPKLSDLEVLSWRRIALWDGAKITWRRGHG